MLEHGRAITATALIASALIASPAAADPCSVTSTAALLSTTVLGARDDKISEESQARNRQDGKIYVINDQGKCVQVPFAGSPTIRDIRKAEGMAKLPGEPKSRTRTVFYVNGIRTNEEYHCKDLQDIMDATGLRVVGIYNYSEGFTRDVIEATGDKIQQYFDGEYKRWKQNRAVATVRAVIREKVKAGETLEMFAHSQGGAITSLAIELARKDLKKMRADRAFARIANRLFLRKTAAQDGSYGKVSVTSFGSAAQAWPKGPEYFHFIHRNDLTPRDLGLGASEGKDEAEASGYGVVVRFAGDPAGREPFSIRGAVRNLLPHPDKYHGVKNTYLRMWQQWQQAN